MKFTRVQNYWNRQALVKYSFLAIMVVFVYQAISIHSNQVNGTSLKNKASTKAEKTITENVVRGSILDRNGNILAISMHTWSLVKNRNIIFNIKLTEKKILQIFIFFLLF